MPRQPVSFQSATQHVIIHENNRKSIFHADEDYRFYPKKVQTTCEKHTCAVHAYALMTNHVHLLITPHKKDGISKTMQMIGHNRSKNQPSNDSSTERRRQEIREISSENQSCLTLLISIDFQQRGRNE